MDGSLVSYNSWSHRVGQTLWAPDVKTKLTGKDPDARKD